MSVLKIKDENGVYGVFEKIEKKYYVSPSSTFTGGNIE